jgi:protein phosphatase
MSESHSVDTAEFPVLEKSPARHFGPSPPPVKVKFGALSHQGLVRKNNEDHYLVIERRRARTVLLTNVPAGLFPPADDISYAMAVADGMGGNVAGELASMLALRSAWDQAPSAIKWNWIIIDEEIEELREKLEIIFQRMNRVLLEVGKAGPEYKGMGTTFTGAFMVGPDAFIAHIGDSRAYLFHAGKLTQLTRDQTMAQACLDAGLPAPRSWYHRLTHCLGGPEQHVQVEFHHVHVTNGDQLLLCTDGLSDMLSREEITQALARTTHPQEAAQALVAAALERGGKDNVTVIVANYAM